MIQRQKIDLSEERRILSYMITSTPFLTKLKDIAQPKFFQSSFSRIVAEWIWEYFEHSQQAPEKSIEDIYLKKKSEIVDEDDRELIAEFLQNLSSDWTKVQVQNVSYTVKNAIDFFKLRSLDRLRGRLGESIQAHDSAFGERLISEYRKIERLSSQGIDLLQDTSAIIAAFSHEQEFLFSYPGALGQCVGPFMRADFFAIMGSMKKGKSHYLWYTGYRAMMMELKVIFISLEMSEKQMLRRMWQTMVGKPVKGGSVQTPYFGQNPRNDMWDVKQKNKPLKAVDLERIKAKQEFYRKSVRTGGVKLITFPSNRITVKDIETALVNLEYYEGLIPDVVIVDYADLMRPVNNRAEYRNQLNDIWMSLRGMAQERSILVVTATQTGRQGLQRDSKGWDVAEDIRKLAHVTKMISINQNEKEEGDGVMRIETVAQREGKRFIGNVVVLQCLDIGRPYMDSRVRSEVNMEKYEDEKKKK